jgi:hypothetical protein
MAEYIQGNSNDVTQDIETSQYKIDCPLTTEDSQNSSRDYDIQIAMHIGNVDVSMSSMASHSSAGSKLVLTVYGNDLRNKYPNKIGNVFSFLFVNGDPMIILGPQCK